MNNNSLNISENQNSVYNLYYYTGFNVIYQLFFSLTVLFTAVSLTGIVLRIGNTGIIASVPAIFNMMTGILLLMARILESSSSMHAWIDSFYIDGVVKGQIETAQLMDKIPVLYILLVILGILELMMVKKLRYQTHKKCFLKINRLTQWFFLCRLLLYMCGKAFIRRNILSEIKKMVIHKE